MEESISSKAASYLVLWYQWEPQEQLLQLPEQQLQEQGFILTGRLLCLFEDRQLSELVGSHCQQMTSEGSQVEVWRRSSPISALHERLQRQTGHTIQSSNIAHREL
ncbi:hypothetical protein CISG_05359 [Coccidioides immitis RMSCC 3703]|uniref:Uncharacterized protein n=2 Tax=Coccidioides immitis TaxID=5501 RepID=A0A0J8TQW5_COCIT|nr:hypothetical protein CIRG_04204 [Coccidioides immitis RMSCC 2394]KMU76102.1 hypothetical protein CISG_05359 [Coccidioides immitis RMSCC 3703]